MMNISKNTQDWIKDLIQKEPKNLELLQQALIHDSMSKKAGASEAQSNERLEFLGDRILALSVAEALYERFPLESEGQLALRLAYSVSRKPLSLAAENIGLGAHILISFAEEKAKGRENPAILADGFEALIAYLYLEYGMDFARSFILKHLEFALQEEKPPKDPKSALQEWAQQNGYPLPEYQVISKEGPDHAPQFVIHIKIGEHEGKGKAESKKKAQRIAAQHLLSQLEKK